ncbi:MAG: ATP-binding protein [Planctomycetota bacterium]|nr:ATP-binding protein [Planctomycetota bacterium]
MGVPSELAAYWQAVTLERRTPAWIDIAPDGTVRSAGGDLDRYGLAPLAAGDRAQDALPFLVGQTPAGGEGFALPFVQMGESLPAEVHVIPHEGGTRVLMLDVAMKLLERQAEQQRRHEAALRMREDLERDASGFADALGVLVLQQAGEDAFRPFARVPAWARELLPDTGRVVLAETFPYLESFVSQAEEVWERRASGLAHSGPWTQSGAFGSDLHLEATAMYLSPVGPVLLVELLGDQYWQRQRALQLARDRRLALDDLRRQQDQREVLLHTIVHDLKGPLTGIVGAVDLLGKTAGLPEAAKPMLHTARRGCQKQQGLIEDIAAVFRETGGLGEGKGEIEVLPLSECAREVAAYMEPGFTSIEREIHIAVDEDAEDVLVHGNASRIERVFANLLENARRHTPRGGRVTVRVSRRRECLVVRVENEGDEVPDDLRDNLFDRFVSGTGGGTSGLGLYYCRITVERWGGSIHYEPLEGGGAVFVFKLPVA